MDITVTVTQHDIDTGLVASISHCPIAKAIRRDHPDSVITVGARTAFVDWKIYEMPDEAYCFMFDLCRKKHVIPFTFTLHRI